MLILLLQVLLAYVRFIIWLTINASLRILDLNVISCHWLTQLQNSCENVASHEEKLLLGQRNRHAMFQFLPGSPELCV